MSVRERVVEQSLEKRRQVQEHEQSESISRDTTWDSGSMAASVSKKEMKRWEGTDDCQIQAQPRKKEPVLEEEMLNPQKG